METWARKPGNAWHFPARFMKCHCQYSQEAREAGKMDRHILAPGPLCLEGNMKTERGNEWPWCWLCSSHHCLVTVHFHYSTFALGLLTLVGLQPRIRTGTQPMAREAGGEMDAPSASRRLAAPILPLMPCGLSTVASLQLSATVPPLRPRHMPASL